MNDKNNTDIEKELQKNIRSQTNNSVGNDSRIERIIDGIGENGEIREYRRNFIIRDGIPETTGTSVKYRVDCGHVIESASDLRNCVCGGHRICKDCIDICNGYCKRQVCKHHWHKINGKVYCRTCFAFAIILSPFKLVFHMIMTILFGLLGKDYKEKGDKSVSIQQQTDKTAEKKELTEKQKKFCTHLYTLAEETGESNSEWFKSEINSLIEKWDYYKAKSLYERLKQSIENKNS